MADLTHDIADDGFHEIHLSGKQLVFLFMATTVVWTAVISGSYLVTDLLYALADPRVRLAKEK